MSALLAKVLPWAVGGLAALLAAAGLWIWLLRADLAAATAERDKMAVERQVALDAAEGARQAVDRLSETHERQMAAITADLAETRRRAAGLDKIRKELDHVRREDRPVGPVLSRLYQLLRAERARGDADPDRPAGGADAAADLRR